MNNKVNPFVFLIIGVMFFLNPMLVTAATDQLDFSVISVPSDKQKNKAVSYFDLMVKPKDEFDLKLRVKNLNKEKITVRIDSTNAITNNNGVIDYSKQSPNYTYDSTLSVPFTSIVEEKSKSVDLNPSEEQDVSFHVKMPREKIKGIILGGFVAQKDLKNQNVTSVEGVTLNTAFNMVTGVVISENEMQVIPKLIIKKVKPDLVNYRTAVMTHIQNPQPLLMKDLKIDTTIRKKGTTKILLKKHQTGLEMAPNSNFENYIFWGDQPLYPGKYQVEIVVTSQRDKWKASKEFEVTDQMSQKFNEGIEVPSNNNWLRFIIYILGGVGIIVLVAVCIYVYHLKHKKKKSHRRKK
ncbi:DUF916 and DUF3324 domain-containing protein [Vagococcus vulneris]|uniref:Uncharacterized protein n=1 Tax=Vagococcus vulneris TaxID=1977869 RepID=A0A429ZTV2_9ENTE|nr:DUF916 and DUF3324 domain-containing protein [Vagococcus vulneris]RST97158.1 hypothetical protein CBF37_10275 [Vagococcus vulneris]